MRKIMTRGQRSLKKGVGSWQGVKGHDKGVGSCPKLWQGVKGYLSKGGGVMTRDGMGGHAQNYSKGSKVN